MAFPNIFKKRDEKDEIKEKEEKDVIVKDEKKEPSEEKPQAVLAQKKEKAVNPKKGKAHVATHFILKSAHISEKAGDLGKEDKYIFKVFDKTNKRQVKEAIESVYNVNVETVNIVSMPGKKKRMGKYVGKPKRYKKAIVKIKKGQKIEVF